MATERVASGLNSPQHIHPGFDKTNAEYTCDAKVSELYHCQRVLLFAADQKYNDINFNVAQQNINKPLQLIECDVNCIIFLEFKEIHNICEFTVPRFLLAHAISKP